MGRLQRCVDVRVSPPQSVTVLPATGTGRVLATLGVAGAALAVATVGVLHMIDADTVDPIRRTISEYALGADGWLFDVGVLGLAGGAALVLAALLHAGVVRWPSPATVLYGIGVAGLALVVVFEKTNWAVGPSVGGSIHRYSSLVAFVTLPLAILLIARRVRARWAALLGAVSLAWLAAIMIGIPLGPLFGRSWWQFLPLGLVERGMALTLVAAVVALALWVAAREPDKIAA